MNLYLVKCKLGLSGSIHGRAYVAASSPTEAYLKLRDYLNAANIGFANERELHTIELLASDVNYPDCGYRFFP